MVLTQKNETSYYDEYVVGEYVVCIDSNLPTPLDDTITIDLSSKLFFRELSQTGIKLK